MPIEPKPIGKPQQVIGAFAGLLALVSRQCDAFVERLEDGEAEPLDAAKIRGAVAIIEAATGDVYRALDSIAEPK